MPELEQANMQAGWKTVSMGDVVEVINDYWDRDTTNLERFVAGEHIDEGDLRIRRWGMTDDDLIPPTFNRKFREGDALLHSRNLDKVAQPDFGGITGEKIFILRSKDEESLLQDLIPYLVASDRFRQYAESRWAGSTNKFLNKTPLMQYEFALPPMEEQRRIAEVLQAVKKMLNCTQQITTAADNAYLAALKDFFNCAAGSEPADGISSIAGSSEWKWRRVDEMFSLQLGKMSSKKAREGEGQAKYIKNTNVLWGEFSLGDLPQMSFNERERDKFALEPGDLLVCEGGEIGRAAIWSGDREDIYYQKALHRLRPIIPEASTSFFMHYLRACSINGILNKIATGGTILHLPRERLAELRLPFPSVSEQARLLDTLESLQQSSQESKRRSDRLKKLKTALFNEGMAP